jgi:CRP/FNR family transcriptional regulator
VGRHELYKLADWIKTRGALHQGDRIFFQGDAFYAIYAVRAGHIKTYVDNEEGARRIIGFYMPGEIFGLESISSECHQCSAEALDTAIVCKLPFHELGRICSDLPGIQNQLLRLMSRELVMASLHSLRHSTRSKLAAFLLDWGQRCARRGYSARQFTLPMTRQEIAGYLNLDPATVTRGLSRFVKKGWIKCSRREVTLIDQQALFDLCSNWQL